MKFTKNTTIAEILEVSGVETILAKYKFPCLHCPMIRFEMEDLTIGQVCERYGIDAEGLLRELNS